MTYSTLISMAASGAISLIMPPLNQISQAQELITQLCCLMVAFMCLEGMMASLVSTTFLGAN